MLVYLEEGFPPGTAEALTALGHTVKSPICGEARSRFGRGQMIIVRRDAEAAPPEGAPSSPTRAGKRQRTSEALPSSTPSAGTGPSTRILWGGSDGRGDGMAVGW